MDSNKDNKKQEPDVEVKQEPKQELTNEKYKYKSQKQMEQLRTYVYQTECKRSG